MSVASHSLHSLSAASFVGMWVVMMVPMMLPSLVPMLWRYREAVGSMRTARLNMLTALVGIGYFSVWTVVGVAVFPFSSALAAIEMQQQALARTVPIAAGLVILIAGVVQFNAWKARHLACCREASASPNRPSGGEAGALQYGARLAILCAPCCANLMVILLVVGMMDLRAMAAVTAAITAERLAPAGERVARVIGLVVIGTAVLLIAQAAGVA
jgi:predicted metal-binding membrane protein